jgi:hypothetical protein
VAKYWPSEQKTTELTGWFFKLLGNFQRPPHKIKVLRKIPLWVEWVAPALLMEAVDSSHYKLGLVQPSG